MDMFELNFNKAFDKVTLGRLFIKLQLYGMQVLTLNWIERIHGKCTQNVVIDGCHSTAAHF